MGRAAGVGCAARKVAVKVEGIDRLDPGTWNVTSLRGKEPELVL